LRLLGFPYGTACRVLAESGEVPHRISLTAPPGKRIGLGQLRVVKETLSEGKLEMVLAYEDYEKAGGARKKGASCHGSGGDERGGTPRRD